MILVIAPICGHAEGIHDVPVPEEKYFELAANHSTNAFEWLSSNVVSL